MCKECCIEPYVDRGDIVHESGTYLVNFKKCAQCGVRSMTKVQNKKVDGDEDEDQEVEITFDHCCSKCNHKICSHFYSYQLDDGYHKYLMECQLCGRGAHEQFAGIKQMYPSNILKKSDKNVKEEQKECDEDKNMIHSNNKEIILNLSAMKQLKAESMNDNISNHDVDEQEWDD